MLILNPLAKLIGSSMGKHDLNVLDEYEEQIYELKSQMKYLEALEICEEALIDLDSSFIPNDNSILTIYIQKVVLHALLSQYTESEKIMKTFEKTLDSAEYYTDDILIQYNFGKALLAQHRNQFSEGEKFYKKSLKLANEKNEIDETYYESHCRLAEIYLIMKEPKRALDSLEKAKLFLEGFEDLDDKELIADLSSPMLLAKASTEYQLGEYENSKETYEELLNLYRKADLTDLDYADILLES